MKYIEVKEIAKKWKIKERKITSLCRENRIEGARKEGKTWLIPEIATLPLDKRTKEYEKDRLSQNIDYKISYSNNAKEEVIKKYKEIYKKQPEKIVFTPYRVCPVGAHSDFQLGVTTGFAIDKGIYIAYSAKLNGIIEISSLQFPKRAQWHILETPTEKVNDWADHLRGATIALNKRYVLRTGLSAIINGELPIGGVSSSAAVIITFITALCKLNNIRLTEKELIEVSQEAENKYIGVACGKLDQTCEIHCKKDNLLFMDFLTNKSVNIPKNDKMKGFDIIIFFSGVERTLSGTKFNMRVDECRSAAYMIKAFANMEYGKFSETNMRDIPKEVFDKYKDRLPENFRKRAEHWYSENDRVYKAVKAWENGDIVEFGRLSFESGLSSIEKWETGSKELVSLYNIMTKTDGIYGGRFSGAGFKGCCLAIVNPEKEKKILKEVEEKYLEIFPHLNGKYSAHICHTADGIKGI